MRKTYNKKLIWTLFLLSLSIFVASIYSHKKEAHATQLKENNLSEELGIHAKEALSIGLLQYTSHPSLDAIADGVIATLAENHYIDGENITIDFQNAQGDQSNLNAMGSRFVSNDVDLMIAITTPSALALANTSQDIPIILGAITDPENVGLVASNNEPGGNITGVSDMTPIRQQLELIRKLQPEAKTLGLLYSSSEDNAVLQGEMAESLANEYGFQTITRTVSATNDVTQVTQQLVSEVDAIWTPNDNIIASAFPSVLDVANAATIPVYPAVDLMVSQGGLATVGLNQYQIGVKTGEMVVELIEGRITTQTEAIRLADDTDLVINYDTARTLGIEIPEELKTTAIDSKELVEED